jgi:hypothetical protein
MTPEEMEQAFRTWWAESYRVPANGQAVSSAVAWGIHLQGLLGGDAAPKGRRFAQIQAVVTDDRNFLFAVATDGTAWEMAGRPVWQQLPPLPEP